MKQIQYHNTSLLTSQIALGCMRIARLSYPHVEELIKTSLSLGITLFDHADIYGGGMGESIFGEVLKNQPSLREKLVLQTKCGIRKGFYDFSKHHILQSVENSLTRLQTSYVDILLLHRPDTLMELKDVKEALESLHSSGKVRYFGVSNFSIQQIELLQSELSFPLITNQIQFSVVHAPIIDQGLHVNMKSNESVLRTDGLLEYCRRKKITIQAWSVLQASWEEKTFLNHVNYPLLNQELETLGQKYRVSKAAIAIAWILRHPAMIQPIVGTTSISHLKELSQSTSVVLAREEWYRLYLSAGKTLP